MYLSVYLSVYPCVHVSVCVCIFVSLSLSSTIILSKGWREQVTVEEPGQQETVRGSRGTCQELAESIYHHGQVPNRITEALGNGDLLHWYRVRHKDTDY